MRVDGWWGFDVGCFGVFVKLEIVLSMSVMVCFGVCCFLMRWCVVIFILIIFE